MNISPDDASKDRETDPDILRREAAWLRLAREGDEESFGMLVKTYSNRMYAIAYRMMGNADDAQEVAQSAWVKAWQRLDSFQGDARFSTWMHRILVNTALDALRARSRNLEVSVERQRDGEPSAETEWPAASEETPDRDLARQEFRASFDRALAELSPEHRAALVLREVDGRSYEEIAQSTGVRIGTVMSRIYYARKHLQAKLKDIL